MNEHTSRWKVKHNAGTTMNAPMVQASISSPRAALYFAAEATPYNFERLRAHARGLHDSAGQPTRLSLILGAGSDTVVFAEIRTLVDELRRGGIDVRFSAEGTRDLGRDRATAAAVPPSASTNDRVLEPTPTPDRTSRSATRWIV